MQQELFPTIYQPQELIQMKSGLFAPQMTMSSGITMRALSWKQPYCSLMLPPYNKVETRIWSTKYRGWVLMCASLQPYSHDQLLSIAGEYQADRIYRAFGETEKLDQARGNAIAIGRLIDCRPMRPIDEDFCYVEFNPQLYCHIYDHVHPIFPIPWKGKQGWSTVSQDILSQITILPPAP